MMHYLDQNVNFRALIMWLVIILVARLLEWIRYARGEGILRGSTVCLYVNDR